MGSIRYDAASGTLRDGIIWEFVSAGDLEAAMEADRVYGEWTGREKAEDLHDCPVSKQHVTERRVLSVSIDLFGGAVLGDFLSLTNHGFNIVSRPFAERLKRSGLTGFATRKGVTINVNQSDAKDPEFFLLDVVGRGGFCTRWHVEGAPNSCPYCGREPVVCSGCYQLSKWECQQCGKEIYYDRDHPEQADGKKLLFDRYSSILIVDGKNWDGSDWFLVDGDGGGWFVNRRAKSWFEATHTLDTKFKPALLNVEGMKRLVPTT
jgi:hypothetical protein